jgi:L-ascorbate metabolism protein UlaG (beta-lactamase superfamily)
VTSRGTLTWLGHSCATVRLDGLVVITDPALRQRIIHLRRAGPVDGTLLDGVDVILVSHVHYDHLDLRSLSYLDRAVPVVVPAGAGALLRRRGFRDVHEVEAGDELDVAAVRIRATHAEHGSARRPGTRRTAAVGFVLAGRQSVYFAGDTDLFDGMAALGPVDLALLPVAGWGPRLPPGHLDPRRAAEALALVRPRIAIPIHWGTYAPWRPSSGDDLPAREFAEAAATIAPDVVVRVLRPGETSPLD